MSNCLNCNEPLEQTPGKKEKQFCNVSCRSSYWQKKKRAEAAEPFQDRVVEQKKADPVTLPPAPRPSANPARPPVMPPGLTPTAQQAWLKEQRKKLQEGRFK